MRPNISPTPGDPGDLLATGSVGGLMPAVTPTPEPTPLFTPQPLTPPPGLAATPKATPTPAVPKPSPAPAPPKPLKSPAKPAAIDNVKLFDEAMTGVASRLRTSAKQAPYMQAMGDNLDELRKTTLGNRKDPRSLVKFGRTLGEYVNYVESTVLQQLDEQADLFDPAEFTKFRTNFTLGMEPLKNIARLALKSSSPTFSPDVELTKAEQALMNWKVGAMASGMPLVTATSYLAEKATGEPFTTGPLFEPDPTIQGLGQLAGLTAELLGTRGAGAVGKVATAPFTAVAGTGMLAGTLVGKGAEAILRKVAPNLAQKTIGGKAIIAPAAAQGARVAPGLVSDIAGVAGSGAAIAGMGALVPNLVETSRPMMTTYDPTSGQLIQERAPKKSAEEIRKTTLMGGVSAGLGRAALAPFAPATTKLGQAAQEVAEEAVSTVPDFVQAYLTGEPLDLVATMAGILASGPIGAAVGEAPAAGAADTTTTPPAPSEADLQNAVNSALGVGAVSPEPTAAPAPAAPRPVPPDVLRRVAATRASLEQQRTVYEAYLADPAAPEDAKTVVQATLEGIQQQLTRMDERLASFGIDPNNIQPPPAAVEAKGLTPPPASVSGGNVMFGLPRGGGNFPVQFADDVDKALYLLQSKQVGSQAKKKEILNWLMSVTGKTEAELLEASDLVRDQVALTAARRPKTELGPIVSPKSPITFQAPEAPTAETPAGRVPPTPQAPAGQILIEDPVQLQFARKLVQRVRTGFKGVDTAEKGDRRLRRLVDDNGHTNASAADLKATYGFTDEDLAVLGLGQPGGAPPLPAQTMPTLPEAPEAPAAEAPVTPEAPAPEAAPVTPEAPAPAFNVDAYAKALADLVEAGDDAAFTQLTQTIPEGQEAAVNDALTAEMSARGMGEAAPAEAAPEALTTSGTEVADQGQPAPPDVTPEAAPEAAPEPTEPEAPAVTAEDYREAMVAAAEANDPAALGRIVTDALKNNIPISEVRAIVQSLPPIQGDPQKAQQFAPDLSPAGERVYRAILAQVANEFRGMAMLDDTAIPRYLKRLSNAIVDPALRKAVMTLAKRAIEAVRAEARVAQSVPKASRLDEMAQASTENVLDLLPRLQGVSFETAVAQVEAYRREQQLQEVDRIRGIFTRASGIPDRIRDQVLRLLDPNNDDLINIAEAIGTGDIKIISKEGQPQRAKLKIDIDKALTFSKSERLPAVKTALKDLEKTFNAVMVRGGADSDDLVAALWQLKARQQEGNTYRLPFSTDNVFSSQRGYGPGLIRLDDDSLQAIVDADNPETQAARLEKARTQVGGSATPAERIQWTTRQIEEEKSQAAAARLILEYRQFLDDLLPTETETTFDAIEVPEPGELPPGAQMEEGPEVMEAPMPQRAPVPGAWWQSRMQALMDERNAKRQQREAMAGNARVPMAFSGRQFPPGFFARWNGNRNPEKSFLEIGTVEDEGSKTVGKLNVLTNPNDDGVHPWRYVDGTGKKTYGAMTPEEYGKLSDDLYEGGAQDMQQAAYMDMLRQRHATAQMQAQSDNPEVQAAIGRMKAALQRYMPGFLALVGIGAATFAPEGTLPAMLLAGTVGAGQPDSVDLFKMLTTAEGRAAIKKDFTQFYTDLRVIAQAASNIQTLRPDLLKARPSDNFKAWAATFRGLLAAKEGRAFAQAVPTAALEGVYADYDFNHAFAVKPVLDPTDPSSAKPLPLYKQPRELFPTFPPADQLPDPAETSYIPGKRGAEDAKDDIDRAMGSIRSAQWVLSGVKNRLENDDKRAEKSRQKLGEAIAVVTAKYGIPSIQRPGSIDAFRRLVVATIQRRPDVMLGLERFGVFRSAMGLSQSLYLLPEDPALDDVEESAVALWNAFQGIDLDPSTLKIEGGAEVAAGDFITRLARAKQSLPPSINLGSADLLGRIKKVAQDLQDLDTSALGEVTRRNLVNQIKDWQALASIADVMAPVLEVADALKGTDLAQMHTWPVERELLLKQAERAESELQRARNTLLDMLTSSKVLGRYANPDRIDPRQTVPAHTRPVLYHNTTLDGFITMAALGEMGTLEPGNLAYGHSGMAFVPLVTRSQKEEEVTQLGLVSMSRRAKFLAPGLDKRPIRLRFNRDSLAQTYPITAYEWYRPKIQSTTFASEKASRLFENLARRDSGLLSSEEREAYRNSTAAERAQLNTPVSSSDMGDYLWKVAFEGSGLQKPTPEEAARIAEQRRALEAEYVYPNMNMRDAFKVTTWDDIKWARMSQLKITDQLDTNMQSILEAAAQGKTHKYAPALYDLLVAYMGMPNFSTAQYALAMPYLTSYLDQLADQANMPRVSDPAFLAKYYRPGEAPPIAKTIILEYANQLDPPVKMPPQMGRYRGAGKMELRNEIKQEREALEKTGYRRSKLKFIPGTEKDENRREAEDAIQGPIMNWMQHVEGIDMPRAEYDYLRSEYDYLSQKANDPNFGALPDTTRNKILANANGIFQILTHPGLRVSKKKEDIGNLFAAAPVGLAGAEGAGAEGLAVGGAALAYAMTPYLASAVEAVNNTAYMRKLESDLRASAAPVTPPSASPALAAPLPRTRLVSPVESVTADPAVEAALQQAQATAPKSAAARAARMVAGAAERVASPILRSVAGINRIVRTLGETAVAKTLSLFGAKLRTGINPDTLRSETGTAVADAIGRTADVMQTLGSNLWNAATGRQGLTVPKVLNDVRDQMHRMMAAGEQQAVRIEEYLATTYDTNTRALLETILDAGGDLPQPYASDDVLKAFVASLPTMANDLQTMGVLTKDQIARMDRLMVRSMSKRTPGDVAPIRDALLNLIDAAKGQAGPPDQSKFWMARGNRQNIPIAEFNKYAGRVVDPVTGKVSYDPWQVIQATPDTLTLRNSTGTVTVSNQFDKATGEIESANYVRYNPKTKQYENPWTEIRGDKSVMTAVRDWTPAELDNYGIVRDISTAAFKTLSMWNKFTARGVMYDFIANNPTIDGQMIAIPANAVRRSQDLQGGEQNWSPPLGKEWGALQGFRVRKDVLEFVSNAQQDGPILQMLEAASREYKRTRTTLSVSYAMNNLLGNAAMLMLNGGHLSAVPEAMGILLDRGDLFLELQRNGGYEGTTFQEMVRERQRAGTNLPSLTEKTMDFVGGAMDRATSGLIKEVNDRLGGKPQTAENIMAAIRDVARTANPTVFNKFVDDLFRTALAVSVLKEGGSVQGAAQRMREDMYNVMVPRTSAGRLANAVFPWASYPMWAMSNTPRVFLQNWHVAGVNTLMAAAAAALTEALAFGEEDEEERKRRRAAEKASAYNQTNIPFLPERLYLGKDVTMELGTANPFEPIAQTIELGRRFAETGDLGEAMGASQGFRFLPVRPSGPIVGAGLLFPGGRNPMQPDKPAPSGLSDWASFAAEAAFPNPTTIARGLMRQNLLGEQPELESDVAGIEQPSGPSAALLRGLGPFKTRNYERDVMGQVGALGRIEKEIQFRINDINNRLKNPQSKNPLSPEEYETKYKDLIDLKMRLQAPIYAKLETLGAMTGGGSSGAIRQGLGTSPPGPSPLR